MGFEGSKRAVHRGSRVRDSGKADRAPGSVAIDYEAKLSALTLDFCRKLSDAAFGQRIRFKGKRKVDDSVACELIPFDYFREPRGFFSGTDKIEPFASGLDDTAIFECATSNMDTVWHEVLVNRDDFLKWFKQEFPQLQSDIAAPECRPNANLNATQMSRTGAAGRPSAMHLVKQEFERRERDGEIPRGTSAKKICEELADWYQNGPRKEHPQLPPLAFETIRKSLRDDIRRAGFTAG